MRLAIRLICTICIAVMSALPSYAQLTMGKYGRALAPLHHARVAPNPGYTEPPITVECWARIRTKSAFNILISNESKTSSSHWEIYTAAGSGYLAFYAPGCQPAILTSTRNIADNAWHYIALQFSGNEVALYADGAEALRQAITRDVRQGAIEGPLLFGAAQDQGQLLECDGAIDEVRITRGVLPISGTPNTRFSATVNTIGLWRLDKLNSNGQLDDLSSERNPAQIAIPTHESMDDLDYRSFHPGPSPFSSPATQLNLIRGSATISPSAKVTTLDGRWQLAEGGVQSERIAKAAWNDSVTTQVPGSVHTALVKAGRIPDPKFGRNDAIAHAQSYKTWYYRLDFARPTGLVKPWLRFAGVAFRCTVWLNGRLLGSHDGMFGGPEYDIDGLLRDRNTLIVKIDPATGNGDLWDNPAWVQSVVFNNVWGWHYSSIPALGIWRSVTIESTPQVKVQRPFVTTTDAHKGLLDMVVDLEGPRKHWSGTLVGEIAPENFNGTTYRFSYPVANASGVFRPHLSMRIPAPHLWWPNDLGQHHLYRLRVAFRSGDGTQTDAVSSTFGIRTITMAPFPGGPRSNEYNWTFVINGKPTFIKGNGWCTMDSSMDFSRARYERFISLAADQHIQMVRCWGSGMPETDEFYDLCDRYGIMVLQEWPTAWNSHTQQPYDALEETVRLNTLRIRSHPSLAMYGGGNESSEPFGKAIDMMGRYAVELDGTRPFHRGEPWGGSQHNYDCYWGYQPLDRDMTLTAPFFGEFGLACMPVVESVLRYLPNDEKSVWPPSDDGSLAHHTPKFNTAEDMKRLMLFAHYFSNCDNLEQFVTGSQLSQAVGVMHTLERARTRWPNCTGALYYKMNDNYPAASWSCVDWYGAPKLSHYFFQRAFAPLHACVLFDSLNNNGKAVSLPVYLLDDAGRLSNARWEVRVTAFNGALKAVKAQRYTGSGYTSLSRKVGTFSLSASQTDSAPLFVVTQVLVNGAVADETYCFVNFEAQKGCLFSLPRTRLRLTVGKGTATITNTGTVAAVGAAVLRLGHLDSYRASANYLWLAPGQSRTIATNQSQGLSASAWNADTVTAP